jgi:hypothetical protein
VFTPPTDCLLYDVSHGINSLLYGILHIDDFNIKTFSFCELRIVVRQLKDLNQIWPFLIWNAP